jgi:hypothetical protein
MAQRIVYAMLMPPSRLAQLLRVPLKDLGEWAQMAYFHETRRRGLKMREASGLLDVSMRKVALLSKRLKQGFVEPDEAHGLPRRVEFMLWAGPLSEARIAQALELPADEVLATLEALKAQGRVEPIPGRTPTWKVVASEFRLVQSEWAARLDGLNNLLGSVVGAVYGRFFVRDPRAFARTVSLRVRKEDLPKLEILYQNVLWPALVELDKASKGATETEEIDLTILWAPYGHPSDVHDLGDEAEREDE